MKRISSADCASQLIAQSVFRKIETLRVHLAKHEIPKVKGSQAMAPGYGRIDMVTGSIYYQVLLRDNAIDVISRQNISDLCKDLIKDKTRNILPLRIREQLADIPEWAYGVKRVKVKLGDGSEHGNVFIAWDREVTAVGLHEDLPFDVTDIVEIYQECG